MRTFRRLGAIALSAMVISAFMVSPANAADVTVETKPETFVGTALARGLELSILGTKVTVGSSGIEVNTRPQAKATGGGVLLAPGTISTVEAITKGQSLAPPKACLLNLPLLDLVTVQTACGEARASITDAGAPQAFGQGSVAGVDVGGAQLLALLEPVLDLLEPVLDQVIGTVQPLLGSLLGNLQLPLLGQLGIDPSTGLVSSLVDGIKKATALATVKVGTSTSQGVTAGNTDSGTTSVSATAQGAQVDVLPGLALGGAPLLSIIVGNATSTSTFDRKTGTSTPAFDAAIATVRLGLPLLGGTITEIPIKLGSPITLLAGTPLESTIALGAGSTTKNPDGSVSSVADGVSLHLLKGLSGGIKLELAHAESAIGGTARLTSQQAIVEPVAQLAKTGNDPWLPLLGFALLLAAYTSRRVLVARPAQKGVSVSN